MWTLGGGHLGRLPGTLLDPSSGHSVCASRQFHQTSPQSLRGPVNPHPISRFVFLFDHPLECSAAFSMFPLSRSSYSSVSCRPSQRRPRFCAHWEDPRLPRASAVASLARLSASGLLFWGRAQTPATVIIVPKYAGGGGGPDARTLRSCPVTLSCRIRGGIHGQARDGTGHMLQGGRLGSGTIGGRRDARSSRRCQRARPRRRAGRRRAPGTWSFARHTRVQHRHPHQNPAARPVHPTSGRLSCPLRMGTAAHADVRGPPRPPLHPHIHPRVCTVHVNRPECVPLTGLSFTYSVPQTREEKQALPALQGPQSLSWKPTCVWLCGVAPGYGPERPALHRAHAGSAQKDTRAPRAEGGRPQPEAAWAPHQQ